MEGEKIHLFSEWPPFFGCFCFAVLWLLFIYLQSDFGVEILKRRRK